MSYENKESWREQKNLLNFHRKFCPERDHVQRQCQNCEQNTWHEKIDILFFSSVLPTFDPTRLGSLTVSFWCQWDKMFGWISLAHQLRSWLWLKNLSGGFWQDTGEIVDHAIKSDLHKYRYFLWCIVHLCIIT